jgi:hypothetical protein
MSNCKICGSPDRFASGKCKICNRRNQATWRNKFPAKEKAKKLDYSSNNLDKYSVYAAKRRAIKLNATPKWANGFIISEIYNLCRLRSKLLGITFHVDHIVPLQSKLVCGLHVENNLQIISNLENLSKGNHIWIDMP